MSCYVLFISPKFINFYSILTRKLDEASKYFFLREHRLLNKFKLLLNTLNFGGNITVIIILLTNENIKRCEPLKRLDCDRVSDQQKICNLKANAQDWFFEVSVFFPSIVVFSFGKSEF